MTIIDKEYINVGVVGAGTVGGGTVRVLAQNAEVIAVRALPIRLKWLAEKDIPRGRALLDELALTETQLTDNWHDLIDDPDTDIVVELIGGTRLAYDIIAAALSAGKSVCTANKDLMATRGGELLAIAAEHGADLFFEAAVAGGIPIITSLKENLTANRFHEVMGIVNGTTNFILTKMSESGADFASTLKEAQDLGYAEADPTADIEGIDAARKMAILASICYNSRVTLDQVYHEGITHITNWDMAYAHDLGYEIKMVGLCRYDGEMIDVRVHPLLLPQDHPLSGVRDSYNAIYVDCDALEKAMFYGRGAGALPTGSAVAGDVVTAARNIVHDCRGRIGCTCRLHIPVRDISDTVSQYFVRVQVKDQLGVFAAMGQQLAASGVSVNSLLQKRALDDGQADIVLITHPTRHGDLLQALDRTAALPFVTAVGHPIRVQNN
ncbi:MAG: homoserine dehydrogenase [Firmicutes bacterium]|nr:homoserine dehydrogenase [Bacillota bacterium]MBR2783123.1 homoserine dehydrogenase [Bacillota bacterium]